MKPAELHPEHLLERARHATLEPRDASLLERHASECSACAMELRLIDDFASVPLDLGESDTVARLVDGALDRADRTPVPAEEVARHTQPASRSGLRVPLWLAAAIVLLVASAGMAAGYFLGAGQTASERLDAPAPAPRAPEPEPEVSQETAPTETVPEADHAAEEPVEASPPRRRSKRAPTPVTAQDLLSQASSARRQGEYESASELYRTLQRRFPTSREASVSHVALGRILLDDLRDPAGSLAQFDRYLRRAPRGSLALEARVGRAVALNRLGRGDEERRAWEDLVRRHPDSLHADRARQRIEALSPAR